MKIIMALVLIFSFVSCTQQLNEPGYAKDIQRQKERLTQLEIKTVNADLRLKRVEDVSKELLEKIIELKIRFDNMLKLQNNEKVLQEKLKNEQEKNKALVQKLTKKTWKPIRPKIKKWGEGSKKYIKKLVKKYEKSETVDKTSENQGLVGKKLKLIRFIDSEGELLDLSNFEGKKKVLLVILRGFSGSICPACSAQTLAITNTIKQFRDNNVEVLVIYPGKAESVPIFLEAVTNLKENFQPVFKFLLDVDLNFVKLLKIEGSLSKPASLIIDKKGIVRYAYVGKNYKDRPSVKILLKEISKLK